MQIDSMMLPPHSIESEQSILGALLIDNDAIDRMGELSEKAFYASQHRVIFRAIQKQAAAGKKWDVITTSETLEISGDLQEAGGIQYLGNLSLNVPGSANIGRYAEVVRQHAMRREIMAAASELTELVAHKGDIHEALDKAQSRLLAVTASERLDEPKKFSRIMHEHLDVIDRRMNSGRKVISSGLEDLDRYLNGGFCRGQLVIVSARPSHGKTALALHMAIKASIAESGVLFMSMEMEDGELIDRAIASIGHVNLGHLLTGEIPDDAWIGITKAAGKMQDAPLYVLDKPGLNFYQLAMHARRHKRKCGLDLLVVDYLQLMAGSDDEKRHAQIEEITRNMKVLAKELDIAIILLSQLSRKTEDSRRPKLSHLRDSGSIEQDADVVIFIHREEVDNPETNFRNYADIHIAKNRQGKLGRIGATYIGENVRFENFSGCLPDYEAKKQTGGYK